MPASTTTSAVSADASATPNAIASVQRSARPVAVSTPPATSAALRNESGNGRSRRRTAGAAGTGDARAWSWVRTAPSTADGHLAHEVVPRTRRAHLDDVATQLVVRLVEAPHLGGGVNAATAGRQARPERVGDVHQRVGLRRPGSPRSVSAPALAARSNSGWASQMSSRMSLLARNSARTLRAARRKSTAAERPSSCFREFGPLSHGAKRYPTPSDRLAAWS